MDPLIATVDQDTWRDTSDATQAFWSRKPNVPDELNRGKETTPILACGRSISYLDILTVPTLAMHVVSIRLLLLRENAVQAKIDEVDDAKKLFKTIVRRHRRTHRISSICHIVAR